MRSALETLHAKAEWTESEPCGATTYRQANGRLHCIGQILEERQLGVPELVQLSTGGFELEASRRADSLFWTTEVFVVEVSLHVFLMGMPLLREIAGFMAERDHEVYDIPGWSRRPADGALGTLDLAFVRAEGPLRVNCDWD